MEGFLREAMEAGALGMSTGLEFNPGREATTAELVRLNAVAGEYDGIYTSHVRNRDSASSMRSTSSGSPAPAAPARRSRTSTCVWPPVRPTAGGSGRSS